MTSDDEWAIGMLNGLPRVINELGSYPVICAPFIGLALQLAQEQCLPIHPYVLAYARRWLKEAEQQPTRIDKLLCELEEARLNAAQVARLHILALSRPVNTCKRSGRKGHQRRTSPDAKKRRGEQAFFDK